MINAIPAVAQSATTAQTATTATTATTALNVTAGGSTPVSVKTSLTFDQLSVAGLTKQVTLFSLPARGKVLGITAKQSTAFVSSDVLFTALTCSVGSASSPTGHLAAGDVFTAVGATAYLDSTAAYKSLTSAAYNLVAQFVCVGSTLDTLTAGAIDIWVTYLVMP